VWDEIGKEMLYKSNKINKKKWQAPMPRCTMPPAITCTSCWSMLFILLYNPSWYLGYRKHQANPQSLSPGCYYPQLFELISDWNIIPKFKRILEKICVESEMKKNL